MKENGCKNSTGLTYFNQTAALKRSGSDYARLPFSHIKSHRALLQVKWIELDLDAFTVSLSLFFFNNCRDCETVIGQLQEQLGEDEKAEAQSSELKSS